MSKTILVTRPNHDPTTDYLYHWSEAVIQEAQKKHFRVLDLKGNKAKRDIFESYIKNRQPHFLFLNGHGSTTVIAGQNDEPLLIDGDNEAICNQTIVYARSCDAGRALGKNIVKRGTKAFIGYKRKFAFLSLHSFATKPLQDNLAMLFLEPSNLVATTLIKGHTAGGAYGRSQSAMRKNLRTMLSSTSTFEEKSGAFILWSNIKGQVLLGDSNAVL